MSELDFDELDKAVNTLMSDVPKTEPSKTDDIKTLSINSTLSDSSRPSLEQLDSALTEVNGTPSRQMTPRPALTTPPPSLATRRTGRFMDVVHPSSNMKSATRPVMPTSRQGVAIQPDEKLLTAMSDDQSDVAAAVDATMPALDEAIAQSPEVVAVTTPAEAASNDWPDPLDMSGYESEPPVDTVVESSEFAAPAPQMAAIDDSDDDDLFTIDGLDDREPQPLNSPFIADAKVEKRPLGGAPAEENTQELGRAPVLGVLATDMTASTNPQDQLPANPVSAEMQLPPELQSDLMAIETDGGTAAEANDNTVAAPELAIQQSPVVSAEAPSVSPAAPVTSEAPTPTAATGPTSIPQQYREEQSTSDQSNGSIYDTASYHQPLAHPAKTKSGWLWVIWILLLLIVGGGGAVALYFLGII